MDRPKWTAASKVTDFRKYHLSGDLDQQLEGLVDHRISQFEMAMAEELRQWLEDEKENSKKLEADTKIMHIQNELELEKLKQQQWKVVLDKLKEAREQAAQEHDKCMQQMQELAEAPRGTLPNSSLEWFKAQKARLGDSNDVGLP